MSVLLVLVAGLAPAMTSGAVLAAEESVVWLCHPGMGEDPCRGDMTTTRRTSDGDERVVTPGRAHRQVDCFYVYPTVSDEPTPNSSRLKAPEVQAVARQQAARFSQECRMFVPVYRQRTIVGLQAGRLDPSIEAAAYQTAYADVRRAWRAYLRHDNHGRGVVLIGHSQGSRLLRWLIREEIDPRPRVRARLVSAILPGANVLVPQGRLVGGDFRHVPVCRRAAQTGCVLAWSSFDETPPKDSRYGRSPTVDDGTGLPIGRRYEVVCTNPTSLRDNARRTAQTILRTEPFPGIIGLLLLKMYSGPPPTASTPWLVPADRYTVRCESRDGARVLMVRPVGDSQDLEPSPDDTWGLHLADVNLVLGDVLAIVRAQKRAYLSR